MINDIPKENLNESGIYVVKNNINSKVYVGSTFNFRERMYRHRYLLINKKHFNDKLQNAVNKYGITNFSFAALELCDKSDVVEREQYWLDRLQAAAEGYNIDPCAGKITGRYHSEETKKKISKAGLGKVSPMKGRAIHSEEAKRLNSEKHKGKKRSAESIQKTIDTKKANGYKMSEEAKKKISDRQKGRPLKLTDEAIKRRAASLKKTWAERGGRVFSFETIERMKIAAKKRCKNPDILKKMSLSHKGKNASEESIRKKGTAIIVFDGKLNTQLFEIISIRRAATILNIDRSTVLRSLNNICGVDTSAGYVHLYYKNPVK